MPATISDFSGAARSFDPRPAPTQRNNAAVELKARRASSPTVRLTGRHASGAATWYCKTGVSACRAGYPGGLYAAAGPGLRIGSWRGRAVRVCGNGNCVSVRLIDWCACGGGAHLIDLYGDAFVRLAPLSAGAVHVTVSW
jgi:rare lipoprotein A (peptidoglycan hydrolase)